MRRKLMMLACLAAVGSFSFSAVAGDYGKCKGCEKVKKAGEGFCDGCGKGVAYGLKLASRSLFDALAGTEGAIEDLKNSKCPGCKTAATTNGTCSGCKIFVANDRVYLSPAAHALARGTPITDKKVADGLEKCEGCASSAKSSSFCEGCGVGFVANRAYETKDFFLAAAKAFVTIKTAIKDTGHCEKCAVARVTDGKCTECKVSFKDGEPVS